MTLSQSSRFHLVGMRPTLYSFSRKCALSSARCGDRASMSLIRLTSSRISRDSLLYLRERRLRNNNNNNSNSSNNNYYYNNKEEAKLHDLHCVILSLLDVVPLHDLNLVQVVVRLPVDEVHLPEKLLLVVFQLANHVE